MKPFRESHKEPFKEGGVNIPLRCYSGGGRGFDCSPSSFIFPEPLVPLAIC
jgi:hypothetical protein